MKFPRRWKTASAFQLSLPDAFPQTIRQNPVEWKILFRIQFSRIPFLHRWSLFFVVIVLCIDDRRSSREGPYRENFLYKIDTDEKTRYFRSLEEEEHYG